MLVKLLSGTVLLLSVAALENYSLNGEVHAFLVAGSKGWWNYRHQADVAHAYHTLLNHGIKKKNIIVMMYDDIANNTENPHQGKIYNAPNGTNVYEGLEIDYKGDSVTPENFLAVLQGDESAVHGGNGRVINRQALTTNDRIFVYFSGHGSTGLIAFPGGRLTAKRLNEALLAMHRQHRFSQLVFYLESCRSGSMFKNILRSNINVYAITATSESQESYATYCSNHLNLPCLGAEFSVNWMEDSDETNINAETLDEQFQIAGELTVKSDVMRFGNLSISREPVGWFQGTGNAMLRASKRTRKNPKHQEVLWPSRDVELMHLRNMKQLDPNATAVDIQIDQIEKNRKKTEAVFKNLIDFLVSDGSKRSQLLVVKSSVDNLDCHDKVVGAFDSICIDITKYDYALKYMNALNNLCTKFNDPAKIISALWITCSKTRSKLL